MDETANQAQKGIGLAMREKYWDELGTDEKIERMRAEVKRWQRKCDRLERELSGLQSHQHGNDGTILVPYASHGARPEAGGHKDRDSYF